MGLHRGAMGPHRGRKKGTHLLVLTLHPVLSPSTRAILQGEKVVLMLSAAFWFTAYRGGPNVLISTILVESQCG